MYCIAKNIQQKQMKPIELANQCFLSIINTARDLSFINQECYEKMGCPKLK